MLNRILIIGAGKSSPFLIEYLYERRFNLNIDLTVLADKKPDYFVKNFKDLNFIKVNINDSNVLKGLVDKSYIVISLLPPTLHFKIAQICSEVGVNMITASYLDENIKKLHDSFLKNDSFLFMEMGLDPGIDHMSAMKVIDELKITSKILEFESYTGGLIDYDKEENPWGYKFTWNPMNVILAGSDDAYYIENYKKVFVPYTKLFKNIKDINIPGVGYFEGYPNRDSLKYKDLYKLDNIKNLRRGTLRNKSFCGSWNIFVQLGLTDNDFVINNAHKMSHFDFFSMKKFSKDKSSFLRFIQDEYNLENDCDEIKNLKWIGMFSDEKISLSSGTSAEILLHIINKKWTLNDNELDLDQPISDFFPGFYKSGKDTITIRHLLIHESGLSAYHRYFLESKYKGRGDILENIINRRLTYSPGAEYKYSDLGMILLGTILERIGGNNLHALGSKWFY